MLVTFRYRIYIYCINIQLLSIVPPTLSRYLHDRSTLKSVKTFQGISAFQPGFSSKTHPGWIRLSIPVHPLPEFQDLRAGALLESLKRFGSFFKEPLFTASATEREAGHGAMVMDIHGPWGSRLKTCFRVDLLGSCRLQS